ncbi:maleylacetoacetate isomerase [Thiolinea disciformis]|uniref:maleylacetoacetate isomerase n=1 Tax=Thiolinea disciformis TaxID=125614 RepID=UPI000382C637|nr:maleylacetoacetate isomerase [Thiolinea disciformis]
MKLYSFFSSGTSYRTRIALNLKGLKYEYIPVNLRAAEESSTDYKTLNPQGLVPSLVVEGKVLTQSPAIIEWLEEQYPEPPLLPKDVNQRAHVRALAALIGCDIHPINNKRILDYLRKHYGQDEAGINAWCGEWIHAGFAAYEQLLLAHTKRGKYSFGNTPTLADVYLIPQLFSARRFKVDLTPYPRILAIEQQCQVLKAFADAAPNLQPDAI